MSKETDKSRRQMLKALGAAGLAASAGEAFGLTLFGARAQERIAQVQGPSTQRRPIRTPTQITPVRPSSVSARDAMVVRAVQAAQSAQLGRRRVPLRLDSSTAHKIVHEFKLPPDLARRSGNATAAIEAVALAISDPDATKALRDRLSQLKMREARIPRAFFFIRARRADKTGESGEFNFVLGIVESAKEAAATVMRIDRTTKIPNWTLVPGVFTGSRTPVQGVVKVDSSAEEAPEEEPEEDKDFAGCYLQALALFMPIASPFIVGFCTACVTAVAALPATAGASAIVSIPSCVACAVGLGAAFAVPAALCLGEI